MNTMSSKIRKSLLIVTTTSMMLSGLFTVHAQEGKQEMPVGAVGGAVHADLFTGTATTSIPIEVPPGRGGMQPNLSIVYSSANGNGWLGTGWKLEKGVIDRQSKNGVNYNGNDYVFRLSGINVDLVEKDGYYWSKFEGSFTRVEKRTDSSDGRPYFLATDKTGKTFRFGESPATRVADPNNANKIFRWCLDRVEDTNGNYMTINYTLDQNQAYIDTIHYTGNVNTGFPTTNTVKFHLEDRPDDTPFYAPEFPVTTAKRLKTVELRSNNNLVGVYKLQYDQNAPRSLLVNVRRFGKDSTINGAGTVINGTESRPFDIDYPSGGTSSFGSSIFSGGLGGGKPIGVGDINGDGKADIQTSNTVFLSNGSGFSAQGWGNINASPVIDIDMGDVNGDGKDDRIVSYGYDYFSTVSNTFEVHLSTGGGFGSAIYSGGLGGDPMAIGVGDVNGDGKADIVTPNTVLISNGNGFSGQGWGIAEGLVKDIHVADVNGDGKGDRIISYKNDFFNTPSVNDQFVVYLSTGGSFGPAIFNGALGNGKPIGVGDVNGDGMADIVIADNVLGILVYLSTGNSFTLTQWGSVEGWPVLDMNVGDVNGDGRGDQIISYTDDYFQTPSVNDQFVVYPSTTTTQNTITFNNGYGGSSTVNFKTINATSAVPFPLQVVESITTNDGNGNVSTTIYNFSGQYYYQPEKDFRGFNKATVTGPAGPSGEQTITETWFHQGNDIGDEDNNPNVPHGYLKGAPYRVIVKSSSGGTFYRQTATTYTPPNNTNQAPFFTPPAKVAIDICDGTAGCRQTQTDFTYDAHGNVINEYQHGDTSIALDDRTVERTFSPNSIEWIISLPTSETIYEGLGNSGQRMAKTEFYYDGTASCDIHATDPDTPPTHGNLTRSVRWLFGGPIPPETRMAYDEMGNIICTRDANMNETTMTYDSTGTFATQVTNPLGHVTETKYYGVDGESMDFGIYGQVKSVKDPNNAVTVTEYDALGRRIKVTQPDGFFTETYYNAFGTVNVQHVQVNGPEGIITHTFFDGLGRTIKERSTGTNGQTIVSHTEYDARGQVRRTSVPVFDPNSPTLWTVNKYDPMGRVIETTFPDNTKSLACYDDWITVTIDANHHRKRMVRDAYGRVSTVQEYITEYPSGCSTAIDGPYATTTYEYDVLGNLKKVIDELGNTNTMVYDTLSRKTSMHDPNMGDWTYEYDLNGNLTKQTDAKGQVIAFQYDQLNRRTQKDYDADGSAEVVYTYDGAVANGKGRLRQVQDLSSSTTFFYDNMGRVIQTDKIVDTTTYTTQTVYDGLGRVLTLTYPDNSVVSHTYNGPQLEGVQDGSTTYALYGGFNALGQPGTLTLGNGVTTDYTYDPQNFQLKTLKTVKESTVLQDLNYTFDNGGNVTQLKDAIHGDQTYTYDALDRLLSATHATGAYPNITYTYNEIGNMLSNSQVGTYTYPASGSTSVRPHAVTSDGTHTYTYDDNGNMTSGAGRTIDYDFENRPTNIIKDGKTSTFVYDGDGGRVKKTIDDGSLETATTYIGKLYVCEGTAAPLSCAKMIFAGNQRIAMQQANGTTDYFHPDHLSSTSVLTNSSGVSEQDLLYYPYGDTRINTGSSEPTVEEWKLEVGTFAGGNDLYESSGLGQQTSATVNNLPTDGSQVYVTLSYKIGGVWDHDDYVYTAANTSTTYPLTVIRTGTGTGTVMSAPTGIDCGSTCSASYAENTVVTLTATPATGSTLTGWSGAGCSGTGTCTVTLTQAKTVTATFDTSSGSGTPIKINFQPSASTVPSGYTMDDGSGYTSSRGYGWDDNLTGLMRERNAEADQRLDTNIGLNNVNLNTWTYDLPNGDYLVELASGDATWSHGQRVVVEGTVVIDSIATSGGQYVTVTDHPVTITDGALTITIGQSTTGNYTDLNYVIITPTSGTTTYSLLVNRNGTGSGTVTSTPTGIDCGSTCSASYAENTVVTLTASPATGSTLTGWSGAGCSGTGTCTVTLTQAETVTATFDVPAVQHSLTVNLQGNGSGTVTSAPTGIDCGSTCSASYAENTVVTLTATPATGSTLTGWSGAGCSGTGTCTVTLTQAETVTATFDVPAVQHSLTVNLQGNGSGTVMSAPTGIDCGSTCSASYAENTVVTLTATPATGSTLTGWSGAGCSGTGTCTVTLTQAKTVTATFDTSSGSGTPITATRLLARR